MNLAVALRAHCDEVLFLIIAHVATKKLVMELEIFVRTADLTRPAIPFQDGLAESLVCVRLEPQATSLGPIAGHEAF